MINGHGGNIYKLAEELHCEPTDIIDMSSNVNPLGPPQGLITYLEKNLTTIRSLPEVDAGSAIRAFSRAYQLDSDLVLSGNGTTQFIYTIPQALKTKKALICGPTYADYADACIMNGVPFDFFSRRASDGFELDLERFFYAIEQDIDLVFICNPNNPTGNLIQRDHLDSLCRAFPDTCFIIDESYLPFIDDWENHSRLHSGLPNVIILNSMSKIFRVPGLRIGFLISSKHIIEKLSRYTLPWNVNSLAQKAVVYLMNERDEIDPFLTETRKFVWEERKSMTEAFREHPYLTPFQSYTSFILLELSGSLTADVVCATLSRKRILVRNCANFQGLSDHFIRVSINSSLNNRLVIEAMRCIAPQNK